ncbi:hydrogenase subunit MbhD domain-containing protein [Xanthobacter sp. KR7-225]|uniref:hydrogenase subunit MbhD domain-containing protein n=1 Tax=Xanthobacter sp. KR7-225 TaxID=3156613 RepID=UPI0032B432B9
MSLLFDGLLCLLLAGGALAAVASPAPRAAVLAFMGYGLLLGLAWARLKAPDVALTEIAIGSGISGIVLLRAAAGARPADAATAGPGATGRALAAAVSVAVALALAAMVLALPEPAPSQAADAAAALPATGLGNPVTGVLLAFRALDTLLEKIVLLLALVGVWALARDPKWRGRPAPLFEGAAPAPSAFLARILVPIGVLVGIYLLWTGADAPGGAFQSGATLAAMGLLALMGGIAPLPDAGSRRLRAVLLAGPFGLLAVGFLGWASAGAFLAFPPGIEKLVIKTVEVAITASIALTLILVVLGPPAGEERP